MALNLPKSHLYTERIYPDWKDMFTVVWMVSRDCNFKCEYCYQTHEFGVPFCVEDFMDRIRLFPQPLRLAITGGEPLLSSRIFEIIQICEQVGKMGGKINLQSNLSVNVRKFLDHTSPDYIEKIETSFHPREREKLPHGMEDIINDIQYGRLQGFNITIWHIDYPKMTAEEFLADCKILYDAGITPMRKRYCGDEHGGGTGDAIFVEGKRCIAGHKGICMWENFDISPCDHDRLVLGNLFTDWELYSEPTPCTKPFCGCLGREFLVDKYWDEFYQKEYGG